METQLCEIFKQVNDP